VGLLPAHRLNDAAADHGHLIRKATPMQQRELMQANINRRVTSRNWCATRGVFGSTPHMHMCRLAPMSRRIRPRSGGALRGARGSRTDRVRVFVEVDPAAREILDTIHATTGEPNWSIVQRLLTQAPLDECGRPVGWQVDPDLQQVGRVPVFVEVDPVAAERLDGMRAATGASKYLIVQTLLMQVELDEHRRPVGWQLHPELQQEEFPLKTA
jgi:hypothetical protein